MKNMDVTLFTIGLLLIQFKVVTCDPCLEGNHRLITDVTRSVDYYNPDQPMMYDDTLSSGWYRSVIPGAENIAFHQPNDGHCQTDSPIWVKSNYFVSFQRLSETYTGRSVYSSGIDYQLVYNQNQIDIFQYNRYNIHIRNCSKYNIYYLYRNTNHRYCFGEQLPTCVEEGSCSFFSGWFDLGILLEISYSVTQVVLSQNQCRQQVDFVCNIDHQNMQNTSVFHVQWLVNNQIIKEEQITYFNVPSVLTQTELEISNIILFGQELKCQIKIEMADGNHSDPFSTNFLVEFRQQSGLLELYEGGNPVNFIAKSNVPMGFVYPCAHRNKRNTHNNTEDLEMQVTGNQSTKISFWGGILPSKEICPSVCQLYNHINGSSQLHCRVFGRADGKYEKETHNASVRIYLPRLNINFTVDAQVIDRDKGAVCSMNADPNGNTFDGRWYPVQLVGIFTLYKDIKNMRHFEVQAYFDQHPLWPYVTIVCGVAVKLLEETFAINFCNNGRVVAKFTNCGMSSALRIEYLEGEYRITLNTTGAEVRAGYEYVYIYPAYASGDHNDTEGLCGFHNGNRTDDFRLRNGSTVHPNNYYYDYDEFSNSWRVDNRSSLFTGLINDTGEDSVSLCECNAKEGGICQTLNRPLPVQFYQFGKDITQRERQRCTTRKRSTVYTDDVSDDTDFVLNYDHNFVAPIPQWINGWTKETATAYCEEYLLSRRSVQLCQDVIALDIAPNLQSCVSDIYISGTTNFTSLQLRMITTVCTTEILKNESLFETSNSESTEYTNIAEYLFSSICPVDCSDNGNCSNGTCICNKEYTGYDCSMEKNHIPVMYPLPQGGLCDIASRPCQATPVLADLFIETGNITCAVHTLDMNQLVASDNVISIAEVENIQKVFCQIPTAIPPYIVNIAVSNNNKNYSQSKQLIVYHSTCWNCSIENGCEKKFSSCIIGDNCYAEDETNLINPEQHCNPHSDQYSWTDKPNKTSDSTCWICSTGNECKKRVSSCIISNVCYAEREQNPENSAQYCNPITDEYGWTNHDEQNTAPNTDGQKGLELAVIAAIVGGVFLIAVLAVIISALAIQKMTIRCNRKEFIGKKYEKSVEDDDLRKSNIY